MAELEGGEHGEDEVVRIWRGRAEAATSPSPWVCRSCHARLDDWSPHCPSCRRFDSLNAFADDEGELVAPADTAVVAAPDTGKRVPAIKLGGLGGGASG